jgi:hypothetical protein
MIKYFVVGLVAVAIWVGVGLKFYDTLNDSTLRQAQRHIDECYGSSGYNRAFARPPSIERECGAHRRKWDSEEPLRRFTAGLVGFLFAFVFAFIALLVFFIRWLNRRPVGA